MFHNKRFVVVLIIMIVSSTLISQQLIGPFQVYASESSPYDSGYDHGCDDAGIPDPSDRYINQPEKGQAFHTQEFMSGYDDGFESCRGNSFGSEDGGLTERFKGDSEGVDSQQDCDPSYPDECIAPPPPDLNCADVSATNFKVLPPDPHGFDRDRDGVGCES